MIICYPCHCPSCSKNYSVSYNCGQCDEVVFCNCGFCEYCCNCGPVPDYIYVWFGVTQEERLNEQTTN